MPRRYEYHAINRFGRVVRTFEQFERAEEYQQNMAVLGTVIYIKRKPMLLAA